MTENQPLKYATVCSGLCAPTVAWSKLGWQPQWFSEIEKFPKAVLNYHYPTVPDLGDMTQIHENETFKNSNIDVLCGGTPCQSFSIAGLRKGLDDERGNLMLTFAKLAAAKRPRWLVWENVPGVLSSNGGADFAAFLGLVTGQCVPPPLQGWEISGCIAGYRNAYGVAWRVLDAQYFGLAQRRKRVFVIGYIGDWRPAAAVLFDGQSLRWNPAPSRKKRKGFTNGVNEGTTTGGGTKQAISFTQNTRDEVRIINGDGDIAGALGAMEGMKQRTYLCTNEQKAFGGNNTSGEIEIEIATARNACSSPSGRLDFESETFICQLSHTESNGLGIGKQEIANTLESTSTSTSNQAIFVNNSDEHLVKNELTTNNDQLTTNNDQLTTNSEAPILFSIMPMNSGKDYKATQKEITQKEITQTITTNGNQSGNQGGDYIVKNSIRRLTPLECERLQGFPDNYTKIPYKGKPAEQCPDGPRYKAIGNAMPEPVLYWIGDRINKVEEILTTSNQQLTTK